MRPPHTQLNESFRLQFPFVFRRLQSLQLLLPAHPCFLVRLSPSFLASLGFRFHGLLPLPLLFLTPAVFAFFRPLQFWVLTTQPLFCLSFSSRFRLTASSPVLLFRFRFPGFPRSLLPDFSCIPSRFLYLALLFVSFRPSSLRSHSCSTSAYLRFRFGLFPFFSASFRPLLFRFRLLSLLFLPFRSSRLRLTVASSVPASALASAFSPFSPA